MGYDSHPDSRPTRPKVPAMYGGKYIAWDAQETQIVASGLKLIDVLKLARDAGYEHSIIEYVPRGFFIGGTHW